MTLGEIIKKYREQNGLSMDAFSKKSGISKSYISLLEKNKHPKTGNPIAPSIESIKQAANGMGIDFDELFALIDSDVALNSKGGYKGKKGVRIPVLGYVAAGVPIDAIEEIIDWEEIPKEMAARGEYFGLKIKGDSMAPDIKNKDVVIVRQQPDAENDEIVIVTINGDEGVCKKLKKSPEGITLISRNPAYEPMFFTPKEVTELPVAIVGKVIELRRSF